VEALNKVSSNKAASTGNKVIFHESIILKFPKDRHFAKKGEEKQKYSLKIPFFGTN
jgi:hypothetical protein